MRTYLADPDAPAVIVLSGGQPDLVPEWTAWTISALRDAGAGDSTYLWTDDNLSNDYFWRYLSDDEISLVATWPLFGRVGCFKGYDAASFAFNTAAAPDLFDRQFELFARHLDLGVDCYGYVTLTGPDPSRVVEAIPRLWGPVHARLTEPRQHSLDVQSRAVEAWNVELSRRFTTKLRETPIHLVRMRG